MLVVVRQGLKMLPQCGHNVLCVRSHDGVEKLLGEVVDAQLERAKTLADEFGRRLKRQYQGLHQVAEIREQDAESDGNGEAEVDKDFTPAGFGSVEERIEVFEEDGKQREDVFVEKLKATAADAAKEGTEEQKVVGGLIGLAGEFHGFHDKMAKMRLEDHLVVFGENGDSHESHLEEAEADGGMLLVRLAELFETVDEEAKEDADEALGDGVVAEQVLWNAEQAGRVEHLAKEERHVGGKDLVEDLGLEVDKDGGEKVEHLLFLSAVAVFVKGPALDAVDEQPSGQSAVASGNMAPANFSAVSSGRPR